MIPASLILLSLPLVLLLRRRLPPLPAGSRASPSPRAGLALDLHATRSQRTPPGEAFRPGAPNRGTARVLLVDDEPEVLWLMRLFLVKAGFEVGVAESGEQALALLGEGPDCYGVVVLDLTMPGMGGEKTLVALRGMAPALPVIVASGYSAEEVEHRAGPLDYTSFLEKPYLPSELVGEIRRVLTAGHPRQGGNPDPG